jgi:toxin ParE1/3/4
VKRRAVEISDEARNDLIRLYDRIAEAASPATALSYIERIEDYVRGFDIASERGVLRDDIRPGLRVVGYKHRASIAFTIEDERVIILRIFHGGQNWTEQFR